METTYSESSPLLPSRLNRLAPKGLGTEQVQSLSGYLTDLALAHSVSLCDLVRQEVLPHFSKSMHNDAVDVRQRLSKTWWTQLSLTLDGLNPSTAMWIDVLQELTKRSDLIYTTMYPWAEVLSRRSLIRKNYMWCIVCLNDFRASERGLNRPLLWSLEAVQVCASHKLMLQSRCPFSDCQRLQLAVSPYVVTGFCAYCSRWLGTQTDKLIKPNNESALSEQLWITEQIGMLLKAAPTLTIKPSIQNLCAAMNLFIEESLAGNAKELAQIVGMHHSSVYEIRAGRQLPQLGTLLKLAIALNKSVITLLAGESDIESGCSDLDAAELRVPISRPTKGTASFLDKEQVRRTLQATLKSSTFPPEPMTRIAEKLGYDQSFLAKHFPKECAAISKQYQDYIDQEKLRRREEICLKVCTAILQLHTQGLYPSHKRLRHIIGGALRDPYARQARNDLLRELGYS